MKIKKIVMAMATTLPVLFVQSSAFATDPSASGKGSVAVESTVHGSFALGKNGSASSYAINVESAAAKVNATANHTPGHRTVNAGITGDTETSSFGKAYNVSTGSGSGYAKSAGSADTSVQGRAKIDGVTTGFSGGHAGTETSNKIVAGTNQGSYVEGKTFSGFDTQLHYSKTSDAGSHGVTVSGKAEGYAEGVNKQGALEGLNAAGIANIGATGHFFAKTGLEAQTGTATAP